MDEEQFGLHCPAAFGGCLCGGGSSGGLLAAADHGDQQQQRRESSHETLLLQRAADRRLAVAVLASELTGLGAEKSISDGESQNVRIRLIQVGRTTGRFCYQVVAGPKGPAYKGFQDTCRRVL